MSAPKTQQELISRHPQEWCDSCQSGNCRGEHWMYGSVAASRSRADLSTVEHASIPYVAIGACWTEWEKTSCEPQVYVEANGRDTRLSLTDAEQLLEQLQRAVRVVHGLLTQDEHHLLCDCGAKCDSEGK